MEQFEAGKAKSQYDKAAIDAIRAWEESTEVPSLFSRGVDAVTAPVREAVQPVIDRAGEAISNTQVAKIGNQVFKGMVGFVSSASAVTVRTDMIFQEFRQKNCGDIYTPADVAGLPLVMVDRVAEGLAMKYKASGLGEGAATGSAGASGLLVDIPLLTTMALRAIGEYATYYGFDLRKKEERFYMLFVLSLGCSLDDGAKYKVLAEMHQISVRIAQNAEWQVTDKALLLEMVKKIAEKFGDKLTKKKLMEIVPGVGTIIGAWSSSSLLADICEASQYMYRKRFLMRKYGQEVFEQEQTTPNA